ncbi:hypothetical protein AAHH88_00440 [Candidatus Hodgkinia cicadicola]
MLKSWCGQLINKVRANTKGCNNDQERSRFKTQAKLPLASKRGVSFRRLSAWERTKFVLKQNQKQDGSLAPETEAVASHTISKALASASKRTNTWRFQPKRGPT